MDSEDDLSEDGVEEMSNVDCDSEVNTDEQNEVVDAHDKKHQTLSDILFHILPAKGSSCSQVLVHLPPNRPLFFKGKLKIIRVISGAVECLGNVMNRNTFSGFGHNLFSPKGYSLLRLLAVSDSSAHGGDDIPTKVNNELKHDLELLEVTKEIVQN